MVYAIIATPLKSIIKATIVNMVFNYCSFSINPLSKGIKVGIILMLFELNAGKHSSSAPPFLTIAMFSILILNLSVNGLNLLLNAFISSLSRLISNTKLTGTVGSKPMSGLNSIKGCYEI